MRNIILLLCAHLLCSSYGSVNEGCKKSDMKGRVKSVTEVYYISDEHTKDKGWVMRPISSTTMLYDRNGVLTDSRENAKVGDVVINRSYTTPVKDDEVTRTFNDKGQLIHSVRKTYLPDGSFSTSTIERIYDDAGREISERTTNTYKGVISFDMMNLTTYDEAGREYESTRVYLDDEKQECRIAAKYRYEYDKFGNELASYSYDFAKKCYYLSFSGNYDAMGNMTEKIQYNADASIRSKQGYKYDTEGRLIKKTNYDLKNNTGTSHTYAYDNFDAKGNYLTEIVTFEDGKGTSVLQREIEYYE